MTHHEHSDTTRGATAEDERAPGPEERHGETGRFFGGAARAGTWAVIGAIVAAIVVLMLLL